MINLKWAPFPGADVKRYNVYRSMIGFKTTLLEVEGADTLNGKTLILKMNGGEEQTITFGIVSGIDCSAIISAINEVLLGGQAYAVMNEPDAFVVRSDIRERPGSVEIVGGTAISQLDDGARPRVIFEKSESIKLATLDALEDPEALVTFQDPDGAIQDWYAVTTIDTNGNESSKTKYLQPVSSSGNVCVLEGIVVDLQGRRVPDAEILVKLENFPHSPVPPSHITLEPIRALSGPDGRYSLAVLQGALVQLEIAAIGLIRNITVPAKAYQFVNDLLVDLDYRLAP